MSKIPCRMCSKCGTYHDATVTVCDACGTAIAGIPARLTDTAAIPADKRGRVNETGTFYMQSCPACGTLNFLVNENSPVKYCYSCEKVAIKKREPTVYVDETAVEEPQEEMTPWKQAQENIEQTMGKDTAQAEEEAPSWDDLLGEDAVDTTPRITLTAVCGGCLTFTVEAGEEAYMLGREANQKAFLAYDKQVGRQHCALFYKDGAWWVRDNHAANGTFVDAALLDMGAEQRLYDGCKLTLGHTAQSPAFVVRVEP